jgi:hypothetical protein
MMMTRVALICATVLMAACGGDEPDCKKPQPQGCSALESCPCQDGTTQTGGCNGLTCAEACCGHDGSLPTQ